MNAKNKKQTIKVTVAQPKARRKRNQRRRRPLAKRMAGLSVDPGRTTTSGYANVLDFRKIPRNNLLSEMSVYHKHMRDRYLTGVIHPDLAVQHQIPLKAYSDFPIPTASIGWHTQTSYSPNATGNFLISWRPSCFTTTSDPATSNVTFNNNVALTGSVGVAGNVFVAAGSVNYPSNVSVQRYRLVSAMIKVSYNGSVLNQSGTMLSCCTQDPLVVGNTGAAVSDTLVDRFGNFSLIANGLWNNTINITKDSEGIECLFVPMDPEDLIFDRAGYYQGVAMSGSAGNITSPSSSGAPINYVIAGRNFPTSQCIVVDIYSNYEVVADPTSAPILRSSVDDFMTRRDSDSYATEIKNFAKDGGLIRKATTFDWRNALSDVAGIGIKYLPKILSIL